MSRRKALIGRRKALIAVLLVGLSYATVIQSFSWNQASHFDLIRALNHDETKIDANQANTGDKVIYKGHYYSARAPGLALFALPFYDALNVVKAEKWTDAHVAPPNHPGDEMIYLVGLWGNVLPGLLLLLLVWRVAERYAPGYGVATAVILGLGTMVLPLSTLLFSHVFTAFLGFAAFVLMLRERDGPASPLLLWLAGLAMGYAVASEYPLFFVSLVLGLYLLSRRDALNVRGVLTRAGAYILGGVIGIVPLLLYNHYAFHSWTHLAYSDVPRQQKGFFGIGAPSLKVLFTLLFDSRGLLTISPVLIMGAIGTVLLYRRGKRAEALTIAGICVCYVGYNSGYYLPFGGGFMGPRFLTTMLPFLAFPLGLALKRFPAPTIALAAVSISATAIATITHPLVGYETETVVWMRYLAKGEFQPTIASAYGLGRSWGGIWPFLLAAGGAIVLAVWVTPRLRLPMRAIGVGIACLVGWALFAVFAPTVLGIDHAGLESIVKAGDHTALSTAAHPSFSSYPLKALGPAAAVLGLLALLVMALLRSDASAPTGSTPATATEPQAPSPSSVDEAAGRRASGAPGTVARLVGALALGLLVLATSASATEPAHASASANAAASACRRLRAKSGHLRLGAHRKHLTVLATGDSMIYPIDEELSIERPAGMRVIADRHDGTGLTTTTIDWAKLAREQVAKDHPNAVVISIGGRDGGIPLPDASHHLVACCSTAWLALYAQRLRPLAEAYALAGHAQIYWLALPAPREQARQPLFGAVNESLRLLAPEFESSMHVIPTDEVISPGGFKETIDYQGQVLHPRAPDGIHLSHEGACVERSLVVEAMVADGQLVSSKG